MATATPTVVEQLQANAAEFQRNAESLQQLAFAQGQNLAQKAALERESGVVVNGNLETPESYLVRKQAELDAQKEKQRFAGAMDYTALSYDIARETAKTTREQMEIADKIQRDSSVSLFQDPALAIANAFTLPWDQQAFDGTKQKLAMLNEAKAKLDTTLQQHAKSTDELKESLTDASILSTTKAIKNIQQIREIDATNAALASDAQGIEKVMKAKEAAISEMVKALQAQDHAANAALAKERFEALKEERAERLKQMKEKDTIRRQGIDLVNKARAKDGLPPMTDEQVMFGLSLPKGTKGGDQYQNWLDRGIMLASGNPVPDGENAMERHAYRVSTGVRPKNTRQETLMQLDAEAVDTALKSTKDKTAAAIEADKIVKTKMNAWKANIVPGDTSNPFQPPSYSAIESMDGLKEMKAYPVLATLLTDANKNNPIDHQQVFDTLVSAVIKRDITGNEAAALMNTLYGKVLGAVNIQSDAYKLTGAPLTKWNARVNAGNIFAGETGAMSAAGFLPIGKTVVDLTNPTAVQYQIQRAIVIKLGGSINWKGEYPDIPGGGGFYPPLFQSGVVAPTVR